MNNRLMSLPQEHSKSPINDPSAANLQNMANNVSAPNLNGVPPQQNDKGSAADDSNILVAVRIRPLIQKELINGELDIIRNEGSLLIVLDREEVEHEQENKKITDVLHRSKEQRYAFDKIFREHTQEQIYQETCKSLIKPVLDGYNACVFAYGPTGTGKTYTMIGNNEIPGLNVLTIRDIFDSIKRTPEREFMVQISYVEIYNETIRDLLVPSSSYLELRDDPIKGIQIAGVTELKVENSEQLMNLIIVGNRRRTTEATNANQTSSRSHAVFQITVTSNPRTKNIEVERTQGKLSLIDLAGSERGTVTENRGLRLREGAKINRSLLALANCINALGDKTKKGFFVPYRDSKLTRLLKDSLGGNSKTVMIANISPAGSQIEETLNTLKYASRAKNIKTKMVSNKKLVSMHIAEYKNIINDLRQEIDQLKSRMTEGVSYNQTPTQLEPNLLANQSQCQCVCGRLEDEIEMKKIQTELFENFQERIQLRRALMELEEQNALNYLEIKRRQAEIVVWRKKEMLESQTNFFKRDGDNGDLNNEAENTNRSDIPLADEKRPLSAVPNEIKQEFKNIQTLRMSTDKNTFKREMMNMQLAENIKMAKQIRESIPKRVKHQDKRDYLEIVIKNHVLELQNIELEIHLQIQEKTVFDLKNIIHSQKKIIEENKLDANVKIPWENEEALSESASQNESDDMNVDDIVYDDENEQDAAEEDDEVDFEALEYKDMLERNKSNQDGNTSTSSNPKQAGQAKTQRKPRSNTSLADNPTESSRSRAESKNKKMLLDFEENKENKILENNFVGDDKKGNGDRGALAGVENEQRITDNSPRVGPNLKKSGGNIPINSNVTSVAQSANKNDISVINSVSFPSKDISLALQQHQQQQQQQQKTGKKIQSTGNNPAPSGNFLPPLNPQTNIGTNAASTKNVQSNNIPLAKPPQISNTNNSKEPNRDQGKQLKSNIVAMGIYGKQKKKT